MNRTSLTILVVLVLCVLCLGFYRGWFTLSSPGRDAGSQKVNVNLTLDPDKAKEDAEAVKAKASELAGKATEEAR